MGKFQDLTGQRFGKLVASKYLGESKWLCKCDCGNEKIVCAYSLKTENTKSCGCYNTEIATLSNTTHGKSHTRLYNVWLGIKNRCYKQSNKCYKNYGGRGIIMCDEWKNDFQKFYDWAIKNGYNQFEKYGNCTIDRINVNGNYEPNNCRWIDNKTQCRNKRTNNIIEYNGIKYVAIEFAEKFNINYSTLITRLNRKQNITSLIKGE